MRIDQRSRTLRQQVAGNFAAVPGRQSTWPVGNPEGVGMDGGRSMAALPFIFVEVVMKMSVTSLGVLALSGSLALGAVLLPGEAAATVYRDTSAGGACKPAFGASNKFLFNNTYVENIGTTDQYVVCHFAMDDPTSSTPNPQHLNAFFTAGAAAGTATCQAQYGYYWGTNNISSSVIETLSLAAGETGYMDWDETLLNRSTVYYTLTLSCKIPGSWRLGIIEYWTPEIP